MTRILIPLLLAVAAWGKVPSMVGPWRMIAAPSEGRISEMYFGADSLFKMKSRTGSRDPGSGTWIYSHIQYEGKWWEEDLHQGTDPYWLELRLAGNRYSRTDRLSLPELASALAVRPTDRGKPLEKLPTFPLSTPVYKRGTRAVDAKGRNAVGR